MGFAFHPATHIYTLDGCRLPSVSEVCEAMGIVSVNGIDPAVLHIAAQRGKGVHLAIRDHFEGRLDMAALAPELAPYVAAAVRFCEESHFVPDLWEQPCADPALRYAGTPDAAGGLAGTPTVIDWKAVHELRPGYAVGLAAYARLLDVHYDYKVTQRVLVQLRPDGTYRVQRCQDRHDEAEFRAALFLYQRRQARNGGR